MSQTHRLIETIKKLLKHKNLKYSDLAKYLNVSESSIKRSFAQEAFTLYRIEQICEFLQIDFYELAKKTKGQSQDTTNTLNLEQEKALAKDEKLFTVFYLLISGLSLKEIIRDYKFQELQVLQLFLQLDKLKLIQLLPKNKVQLLVSKNIRWIASGPLTKIYDSAIKNEFIDSDFQGKFEKLRLITGSFTEHSLQVLYKKMDRLLGDFLEFSDLDLEAKENKTQVWFLLGIRPWSLSVILKYRITNSKCC
jgi:transcriptional regulator with XRE-family HTH domain